MARVRLLDKDQAPPKIKELFQKIEGNGARVLNWYKVIAHSPNVASACIKLGNSVMNKAELSPKIRELVILRIARLTGSEYEWFQHVPIALGFGIEQKQIDEINEWKESSSFSDAERAVLQYTDEVTVNVKVEDGTFEVLKKHLDESNIVDLTLTIGYYCMLARAMVALEIDLEEQSLVSISDLLGKS